jgi:hypothetical protein
MPGWWNGRHESLKRICPQGRAGSNPAPGTYNDRRRFASGGSVVCECDARPMYDSRIRPLALRLLATDLTLAEVHRQTGIAKSTLSKLAA